MARNNPFEELERFFDQFSGGFEGFEPMQGLGSRISVDLVDRGDAFELTADVPGYESDDIEVALRDPRTVHIAATSEAEREQGDAADEYEYITRERSRRSLRRTVSLPEDVSTSETSASHDNGVLTVELPKATTENQTEIPVE